MRCARLDCLTAYLPIPCQDDKRVLSAAREKTETSMLMQRQRGGTANVNATDKLIKMIDDISVVDK